MKDARPVAIVTGSSRGVGAAIAKRLAEKHYSVVSNYSKSEREALEGAAACEALGAETLLCRANVAEDEDCRRMAREAVARWGRIDALVNNAGYGSYGAVEDVPIAEARRQFEVNVFGLARLSQLNRKAS